PTDSGKTITLDSTEAVAMIYQYRDAKEDMKAVESLEAQAKGWLQAAMQDASTAVIPGFGEITWKTTKPSKHFDEEAFKANHPMMYEDYRKERPGYRRFLLKPSKEIERAETNH